MTHTLLTITGPSLAGKSTLESMLVKRYNLQRLVSFTTRPIRDGEVDGDHYYFLNRDVAERKIADGEMAEHVEFQGHLYGLLGTELVSKLQKGSVIAVVEPNGVQQLSKYCKENHLRHSPVFITNSPQTLAARFLQRFKQDEKASPINYATRLVNLMKNEQEWIHAHDYDLIFTRFDSSNENYIALRIFSELIYQDVEAG